MSGTRRPERLIVVKTCRPAGALLGAMEAAISGECLRQDILDELEFEPRLDASRIGVAEQAAWSVPVSENSNQLAVG